jgi:hypothetical protein
LHSYHRKQPKPQALSRHARLGAGLGIALGPGLGIALGAGVALTQTRSVFGVVMFQRQE